MGILKKKQRKQGDNPALEMTPMIDVVFQLLIFFIVTLKQEDIFARLEVCRPAPDPNAKKEEQPEDLLNIQIYNMTIIFFSRWKHSFYRNGFFLFEQDVFSFIENTFRIISGLGVVLFNQFNNIAYTCFSN